MIERRHVMGTKDNGPVEYLRFTALENGTFSFNAQSYSGTWTYIEYSIDEGATWTRLNKTDVTAAGVLLTTPTVTTGNSCLWRGNIQQISTSGGVNYRAYFSSTGRFNVSGNILSLLHPKGKSIIYIRSFSYLFYQCTNLIDASALIMPNTTNNNCCDNMFNGCTNLTTAPELPATTMSDYCYNGMFSYCTSLITAPDLPATTLANQCYQSMFTACRSLTGAPELSATTLKTACYSGMFASCSSLVTAPELPATTLQNSCYSSMFQNCSSLTTAPELPALTLADTCYQQMFNYCTSLATAPELPATTLATRCYYQMFTGCTALTTAPELPATTLANYCYTGMFHNCTNLTTAPEILPATTLATWCYYQMFYNCTYLTVAPILPATTLVSNCYSNMFYGCTRLNWLKAMFTTTPSSSYTNNWLSGTTSTSYGTRTFIKNSAATWTTTGATGVPTNWTIVTSRACMLYADSITAAKAETTSHITALIDADHYSISNNNNWFTVSTTGNAWTDIAVAISENTTGSDRNGTFTINCYDENNNLLDTGTITVTQLAINSGYTVNLNNGEWVWDSSLNCYKSDSSYNVSNGTSAMSIEIFGYAEFTIKVRTYGESNYDYLTVGKLDQIPTRSNSTSGTNYWTGYGKASATTWYDVTFSDIDRGTHTINLLYAKDSSADRNDDRAYMQIITE